jgi:subtilisin family serine protease
MRNFWKGTGRVAALALGAKVISELVKCCRKRRDCPETKTSVDFTGAKYIPNEVIVWKRPGVPDDDFREWKRNNKPAGLDEIKLCKYCDDSLELWKGNDVSTLISGKGATTSNPPGGGGISGGGDDIACYSYNLIIDLPEPEVCAQENDKKYFQFPQQPSSSEPPIIIAVFDTGLDPSIKEFYTSPVFSCMPGGSSGWNFFDKNDNTTDDHPSRHGSVVSKFIIDQAIKYRKQKINILPVKVHNKLGKSDLFSILCGFAYAANCGAKIINASFGFYGARGSEAPTILAEFADKHLTNKNILLVAAAGNVNADRSLVPSGEIEDIRNLDNHPFFPACLSENFENVLAVTTTSFHKNAVSPSQNFSKTIVDIGVRCDKEMADDYRFEDSLERHDSSGGSIWVLGSSFATPIVTGILAQHYTEVISSMVNGNINKNKLIQILQVNNPGLIIAGNNPLDGLVRNGNCCEK